MVFTDNQIITLNSKDAIKNNGTFLSDVVFNFKGLLKEETNILRAYVRVMNAQIPVSFYTIDATNDILAYTLTTGGTLKTIVIPNGNYNASSLISTMTTLFTANTDAITPTFNSLNGVLTFSSASSYTYYSYGSNGCSIGNVLGIGPSSLIGTNATCPYPLNLLNKKKIYIQSQHLFNVAYTSYNLGFTTTITTIPVNQPPYNLINYVSLTDDDKVIIHNTTLNTIDIQIIDENGALINFNNIDWSITLCLSIERVDTKRIHIENFNQFLQLKEEPKDARADGEAIGELTQDEKDLELLQK